MATSYSIIQYLNKPYIFYCPDCNKIANRHDSETGVSCNNCGNKEDKLSHFVHEDDTRYPNK